MDSAFIHQAANELVQNAGTRNIKQIARSCSLDISETSRIKDLFLPQLRSLQCSWFPQPQSNYSGHPCTTSYLPNAL